MDQSHLQPFFARAKNALMMVIIEGDNQQPFYLASGVLVSLGGRTFVLTAGHNVWDKDRGRRAAICIALPPQHVSVFLRPGNGSAGAIFHPTPSAPFQNPEPDVAVIEPTTSTIMIHPDGTRPFEESEIRFFDTNVTVMIGTEVHGRQLVLMGFPRAFTPFNPSKVPGHGASRGSVDLGAVQMAVRTMPDFFRRDRASKKSSNGRGFHVFLADEVEDGAGTKTPFESPRGLSGGPVVAPLEDGLLIGLVRSSMDNGRWWDEWCEPAAEAVRLLVDHDDSRVAAATRRVCERYDDDRATALRERQKSPQT